MLSYYVFHPYLMLSREGICLLYRSSSVPHVLVYINICLRDDDDTHHPSRECA